MPIPTEFAAYRYTDEFGRRVVSRWKMTASEAAKLTDAKRIESTVEVRMLPENRAEVVAHSFGVYGHAPGSMLDDTRAMRVIVCGGRNYDDRARVFAALDRLADKRQIGLVIHGAAPGADSLAGEWARARNVGEHPCPADWQRHGRRAGPLRNAHMLKLRPDGVVAFPGGRGTDDMVMQAHGAGVPVWHPFG